MHVSGVTPTMNGSAGCRARQRHWRLDRHAVARFALEQLNRYRLVDRESPCSFNLCAVGKALETHKCQQLMWALRRAWQTCRHQP